MGEREGAGPPVAGGRDYVCIEARGAAVYLRSSAPHSIEHQEEIAREAELLRGYVQRRTHRLIQGAEEIVRFRDNREARAAASHLKTLYPQAREEMRAVFPATERMYLRYTRGWCHLLALALHERKGWPMVGVEVGKASYPTTGLIHVAVECSGEQIGRRQVAPERISKSASRSASRSASDVKAQIWYIDVRGVYCSGDDLLRACGGQGCRTEHSRRVTRRDIEESPLTPITREGEEEAERAAGEVLSWLDNRQGLLHG